MSILEEAASLRAEWAMAVGQLVTCGSFSLPLAGEAVPAGFPSPADDYMERPLDLNEYVAPRPEATFFVRVSGDSMIGAGIHHDDILVVDRSQQPTPGNVVIAYVEGEFTVKRLVREKDGLALAPENPAFSPIPLTEDTDFDIWGVVRHVVHKV